MALAYLRGFGVEACVVGFEITFVALIIGMIVGKAAGRVSSGIFWSVVGAMFGYLSAAGAPVIDPLLRYSWGLVGCVAAVAVAVTWPQRFYPSLGIGALAGGAAMLTVVLPAVSFGVLVSSEWRFDLLCAPLAGAWMGLAVVAVEWAERKTPTPRYIAAAGLMMAVIAGNLVGAVLFPWWL